MASDIGATEGATDEYDRNIYLTVEDCSLPGASLAFVAISLLALQHPDRNAGKFQFALAFLGFGAAVFVWLLIRPQRLLLDGEGFNVLGGFIRSPKKVYWRDIEEFFIYRFPRGGKMIGFNYKPSASGVSPTARVSRQLGADGALPKGWTQSPERMVEELNAYRLRATGKGSATVPVSA